MKEKVVIFFAQYFLYVLLVGVIAYFIFFAPSLAALLFSGALSLLSVFIAKLLKRVVGKKRHDKNIITTTKHTYAFPSSHAAGLSSLLVTTFGAVIWYFIVPATFVILSARVRSGAHDIKDIIGGLLVGTLSTILLINGLLLILSL